MRLWHVDMIKSLPRQQLLGQHREAAALRGKGWGKPHSVVNYVFNYNLAKLYHYHTKIMAEMERRGYNVTPEWKDPNYRGKILGFQQVEVQPQDLTDYVEHDTNYYKECVDNLKGKGIIV